MYFSHHPPPHSPPNARQHNTTTKQNELHSLLFHVLQIPRKVWYEKKENNLTPYNNRKFLFIWWKMLCGPSLLFNEYMYSQSIYRFAASMPHCISFNANAKHVVNGILWNEKPKRNMKACWWWSWRKKIVSWWPNLFWVRVFFFFLSPKEILKLLCTLSRIRGKEQCFVKKAWKKERDSEDGVKSKARWERNK